MISNILQQEHSETVKMVQRCSASPLTETSEVIKGKFSRRKNFRDVWGGGYLRITMALNQKTFDKRGRCATISTSLSML